MDIENFNFLSCVASPRKGLPSQLDTYSRNLLPVRVKYYIKCTVIVETKRIHYIIYINNIMYNPCNYLSVSSICTINKRVFGQDSKIPINNLKVRCFDFGQGLAFLTTFFSSIRKYFTWVYGLPVVHDIGFRGRFCPVYVLLCRCATSINSVYKFFFYLIISEVFVFRFDLLSN